MSTLQSRMDLSGLLRVLRSITAEQANGRQSLARETTRAKAASDWRARSATRHRYSVIRTQTALSAKARAIRDLRAEASKAFPGGLICDPGFDVLLDLFIAIEEGDQRVISDPLTTQVPATTKLRWLKRLEDEGLVERQPDPHDRRRTFITLSEESRGKMRDLIEQSRILVPDPN